MTYLTTWICRFCGVQRTSIAGSKFVVRRGVKVRKCANGAGKIPVAEVDRLIEARGIAPEVAQRAALAKAVGFNDWTSPTVAAGERMHGGPACAFIVRTLNPGHVMAVDLRYFDAELNGGKLLPGRTVTETTGHGKRTVSMLLNGATITRHKAS